MRTSVEQKTIIPFLKWAGGKRWFVTKHADLLNVSFERYVEPFLGGGAIFFHLAPKRALLADINKGLIDCYKTIRSDWRVVLKLLEIHQKHHSPDYYYEVREMRPTGKIAKAAQFIYLNRTCWNGLYRVNLRGEFNVPIGTKTSVVLDTDDFAETSRLLRRTRLKSQDFEKTLDECRAGDLVFVDPPYTVKHNFNGFIKYNEKLFSWPDQTRLRDCLFDVKERGAHIVLLNADHEQVTQLYRGFGEELKLERFSVLAGKSDFRRLSTESAFISKYFADR